MKLSIAEAVAESAKTLRLAGVPAAKRDASSLMSYVLGRDRTFVIAHADDLISQESHTRLQDYVNRRARGEPLQYITGHQEFFGLNFTVTSDVLIPRPETELLVETALDLVPHDKSIFICDVGTGSGCIVVSLLSRLHLATGLATDISENAIAVAKSNARRHLVEDRVEFVVSDGFEAIKPANKFDLVLSNPPYVNETTMESLQREVRDFEPRIALTPGGDGLALIRRLLVEAVGLLKPGGYLLMEFGFDQGDTVRQMVDTHTWELLDIHKDLQGIPRTLVLRKIPL